MTRDVHLESNESDELNWPETSPVIRLIRKIRGSIAKVSNPASKDCKAADRLKNRGLDMKFVWLTVL